MLIDPYRNIDPDFFNTFMLLHCEDGQLYERTGFPEVSVVGDGAVSSAQAKFGTQSFRNPGTSLESTDYISVIGATTDFVFPGEFTWEGWFYVLSYTSAYNNIFSNNINFPSSGFMQLAIRSVGDILFNSSAGGFVASTGGAIPTNSWRHIAVTRNASNVIKVWHHGVLMGSLPISGTIGGQNLGVSTFDVGRGQAGDNGDLDCYLEEIRVTKACRYDADFAVPIAPFSPFP